MKRYPLLALILAAILIMSFNFPLSTVNANTLSETPANNPETSSDQTAALSDGKSEKPSDEDSIQKADSAFGDKSEKLSDENSMQKTDSISEDKSENLSDEDSVQKADSVSGNKSEGLSDENSIPENDSAVLFDKDSTLKPASVSENGSDALSDIQIPDEKPMFSASIEHCSDGYVVKGSFTEFLPDTSSAMLQYSLDGESWQDCAMEWDLYHNRENQICLYNRFEPLKSYLAGELNHFYLRLYITMKNGKTYETQAALIERSNFGPVPEEITFTANFAPSMLSCEIGPSGSRTYCGKYQLTISESSSAEDIAALLPDTLPIQIDIQKERKLYTSCTINCPVTWKPISLSGLTADESVTIRDAAEEILIPAGILLHTPIGTFTLNEPLCIEQNALMTDEVTLVLNVIPEGKNPTGVLSGSIHGLEIAFDFKPTGATAIHAYTLLKGASEWIVLSDLPLLETIDAQPSTANSGYSYILDSDQEPYRSYLNAVTAGENPTPFLIGLKIEGGIYDGCQLILGYPETYDFPPDLRVDGSGGNHGNAGIGSRNDSTEEGQRPNLSQDTPDMITEPQLDSPPTTTGSSGNPTDSTGNMQTGSSEPLTDTMENMQINPTEIATDTIRNLQTDSSEITADTSRNLQIDPFENSSGNTGKEQTATSTITQDKTNNPVEKSPLKALLPAASAAIAGIYITVMVTKAITSGIAGGIIKKS